MKKTLLSLILSAIFFSFLLAGCKKHHSPKPDNPYGLPNATQEGKNTLGFLLNGEPWMPKGFNGTANLSIDVDFNFNEGGFGISAYRIVGTEHTAFGIGISDSLNFIQIPEMLPIDKNTLAVVGIHTYDNNCEITYFDITVHRRGGLTVTKLDKTNRIISGTFNTTLYKPGCSDTIRITQGRFDMRY